MMDLLEPVRDALATIPGIASCKIGLEDNITPDDYPLIRVVPSRSVPGVIGNAGMLTRKSEVLIYFGMPVQAFDDTADGDGRVRLEKVYAALFETEAAILAKLIPIAPAGVTVVRYLETITDEDRLDTYKLMAVRCEVEG